MQLGNPGFMGPLPRVLMQSIATHTRHDSIFKTRTEWYITYLRDHGRPTARILLDRLPAKAKGIFEPIQATDKPPDDVDVE